MFVEIASIKYLKEMSEVICDSIVNLCEADHLNNPKNLQAWLHARSVTKLEKSLFNNHSQVFVCIENNQVIGVAQIEHSGELKLCYVHSQFQGKGVGGLLLKTIEQQVKKWGLNHISLISTRTARDYYLAHGFKPDGEPILCIGMPGYPLRKELPL